MICACCNKEFKESLTKKTFRTTLFVSFPDGNRSIDLCLNHDIELFRIGERRFFERHRKLYQAMLGENFGEPLSIEERIKDFKSSIIYKID